MDWLIMLIASAIVMLVVTMISILAVFYEFLVTYKSHIATVQKGADRKVYFKKET